MGGQLTQSLWAVSPPILSPLTWFLFFRRRNVPTQPNTVTVGDAVLGYISAPVSLSVWHPSSSPPHTLAFVFMTLECLPLFPPHQDTVPQSFTYLATLSLSPLAPFWCLLSMCSCSVFIYVPAVSLSRLPASFHLFPYAFPPSLHSIPTVNPD